MKSELQKLGAGVALVAGVVFALIELPLIGLALLVVAGALLVANGRKS